MLGSLHVVFPRRHPATGISPRSARSATPARIARHAATVCATLLLTAFAGSQRLVVDPNGGGHFRDLQSAVDAAPSGAILDVRGGSYPRLVIRDKSLTLSASPTARIAAPVQGSGTQPAAVQIRGTGRERITLANFTIGNTPIGLSWNDLGPPVSAHRIATLHFVRCRVIAPHVTVITGQVNGTPAVLARDVGTLVANESEFRAAPAWPADDINPRLIPNGAAGIDAPGAAVGIVRTQVTAGEVKNYRTRYFVPPQPCPCSGFGGRGGDAVVARSLYGSQAKLTAGAGAAIFRYRSGRFEPWGRQPAGRPARVALRVTQAAMVSSLDAPSIGNAWTLQVVADPTPRVLVLGLASERPAEIDDPVRGRTLLCVDPVGAVHIPLLPGPRTLRTMIPSQPAVIGIELAAHVARPDAISMPVLETIRP